MIFCIIAIIELGVIVKLLYALKRIKRFKLQQPCGNCYKNAAYERLCERRNILGEAFRQHEQLPHSLYASGRKREIAHIACQQFYINLRNTIGEM